MQMLRSVAIAVVAAILVGRMGLRAGPAWGQAAQSTAQARRGRPPRPRERRGPRAGPPDPGGLRDGQVGQCVQVPVTQMQTLLSDGVSHRDRAGHPDGPGDRQ